MHKKPNIIFLLTDDQRFDTISALGNKAIHTPNMDRLTQMGTAFTHACIPCGTSGAVCMPSRAMVNTGRSLFHIQDAGQEIPPAHQLIGETFRTAGYNTFGSGKWHNGRSAYHRSFTHGDEIFFGGMADHWNVPAYHFDPNGKYDTILKQCPDPYHSQHVIDRPCDHIHSGQHSTDIISRAGIRFIRDHGTENPFYMYISFLAPHDPRTMPQKYLDMYPPETIELPPNFMGGHPFDTGALHIRDEMLAGFPRGPEEVRRHIAEYYAMISHLDDQIGNIMKAVADAALLDNTIFVLAGDNGLALGQHGLMGKQNCYDHSVRVPLLFAGPGVPKNKRTDAFAYLFDVFPTLCELAGIPCPESVEGLSLTNVMTQDETNRDQMFFAYCDCQRAIRDKHFKLIEYVIDGKHTMTQLFDMQKDPWELENLADREASQNEITRLRGILQKTADEWDDRKTVWGTEFWRGFNSACNGGV